MKIHPFIKKCLIGLLICSAILLIAAWALLTHLARFHEFYRFRAGEDQREYVLEYGRHGDLSLRDIETGKRATASDYYYSTSITGHAISDSGKVTFRTADQEISFPLPPIEEETIDWWDDYHNKSDTTSPRLFSQPE
jgi:hypothetical protein